MRRAAIGAAVAAALGIAGCASPARTPAPPAPVVVAPASAPAKPPPPQSPPAPAAELRPEPRPAAPLALPSRVRVGLATELDAVTLPCCDGAVSAVAGDRRLRVAATVTVRPAAGGSRPPVWRLQVAAVREESEAAVLVRRLERMGGARADARFDAASGLYRVRLGGWPSRDAAQAAGRRLQGQGLDAFWVVSEGGGLVAPALDVVQGAARQRVPGRRFELRPLEADSGLAYEGHRYRGALVVFLNDRGRLNLINELPLEDYLRGVVPSELGPDSYPEIEALEAQAVAARSYTLRNLGGFEEEGFDLCGTPKCQVYGGMGVERPLSDRAVAATAGQVMTYDGAPIDALYSSSCGGHTEDVEVVFPLKHEPYLKGVPCIEAGVSRLPAAAGADAPWPRGVLAAALPELPARLDAPEPLGGALLGLARAAGLSPPADRLASLARPEVQRFLASIFDLALDARLFEHPEQIASASPEDAAAGEWTAADRRLAGWLVRTGLLDDAAAADAGRDLDAAEAERLVLRLALRLRVVARRPASFDSLRSGDLLVREGTGETGYRIAKSTATYRDGSDGPEPADLMLAAGDDLDLYVAGGRLLAVVQTFRPESGSAERARIRGGWTRFRTDEQLDALVRQRFPGFRFAGLDVISRGISGRVGRIRLHGRDGSTVDVAGLAVRWTLDLPDTLFTVRRETPARGPSGWRFTGRGWGHGVGLCQLGAYAMARRGHDYRSILEHYYTGARLETLAPAPAAPTPAAPMAPMTAPD